MAVVKTQGTHLYFITSGETPAVVKVTATGISGISASREQIDVTDLGETVARQYVSGLMAPGTANFEIQFDPAVTNHKTLHDEYKSGAVLKWALGWSDGTDDATQTTGAFTLPTTRTWIEFDGYVTDMSFDFSNNSVVKASVSVQVSGFPDITLKA